VPRLLTVDQKRHRLDISRSCLERFKRNEKDFLRRFITVDETWVHHYTPETKEQSKQWTAKDEPTPKKAKTVSSAGKVMATVFWDSYGIIFVDYLEKDKTINGEYYAGLLQRLDTEIKNKRPHLAKKKILFHQDNASAHKSAVAMAKLYELKYELMPHPPYSPDLAPCELFSISKFKKMAIWKEIFVGC
jgi:histone-lysine N-methyltransferase SETMAR